MVKQKYDSKVVAKRLKEELKSHDWKYLDLAEKAGISVDSIKSYGSGRRIPDNYNINALAKALNVSPFYLLGETPFRNKWEEYDSLHEEDVNRIRTEVKFIESAESLGFYHQGSENPEKDYEEYITYNQKFKERKENMKTRKEITVITGSVENRIIENFVTGEITIQAVSEEDVERGFQQLIRRGIIAE